MAEAKRQSKKGNNENKLLNKLRDVSGHLKAGFP